MTEPAFNVVVVGGSSGLGKVVSKMYADRGHRVVIVSRKKPSFAGELDKFVHISTDLEYLTAATAKTVANEIIREVGEIRYLIFCQRYRGNDKNLANETSVSLSATGYLIDAFSDAFPALGDKAIAVVSSVYGDYVGSSQPLDYHIVKAGLNAMVRYYAVSLGARGIRINAISPLTYLKDESKHVYLEDEKKLEKYRKLVPLKRMGTARESANTIGFLCSKQSSFITGQNLYVDGGVSVVWPEELI